MGQANDGAGTSSGMMIAGWVERSPTASEDQDVDHYFVRDDGAWIIAVGLVLNDQSNKPVEALAAALPLLAVRANRFNGGPAPGRLRVRASKGPSGLSKAAEPAAEAEFDLDDPLQLHVYAALISLGHRYVYIVSGNAHGTPPIAEARDLARRIRF